MAETKGLEGRITIRTVAKDAGVSVSAVSKVLRNAYGVSDELRGKVQDSIDRLGYRPSSAARGMRGKTDTVGILLVGLDNPFLNKVVQGINAVLGEAGYKTMFGVGRAETYIETSLIDSMIDFKMDGLILIGPRLSGATLARYGRQIPLVTIAHHEADADAVDTVNSDDREGGRIAAQALIEKGYRDIAMLSLPRREGNASDVWLQREAGYASALTAAGLGQSCRILRIDEPEDVGIPMIDALLGVPDRPRAIFCWSDLHGVMLLNRAVALGLRVPEDIAIVGYDNSPLAAMPMVDLSSVRQSAAELGATAARCILSRLSGRTNAEHHLLRPELVVRGSM